MQKRTYLKLLSSLLILTSLTSCKLVTIHDMEVCGDMGAQGAACAHTLTDATRSLDLPTWNETRFGWLCVAPDSFAELKKAIEQLCHGHKECSFEKLSIRTHEIQNQDTGDEDETETEYARHIIGDPKH